MRLGKQARVLTDNQVKTLRAYLTTTRHPERNEVAFLLSVKAGLRAKEIGGLTWAMVCDAEGRVGDHISLESRIAKKGGGGVIPLHPELKTALIALRKSQPLTATVLVSERRKPMQPQVIVNLFKGWFKAVSFDGCSSHSGRRTFITKLARNVGRVGGSMRDVQALARHSSLAMTQRYVDCDAEAQRKAVALI